MGFYFRKSVNLGGLRFNFSKSGVGVSTGVKGFRIGSGPRGNYVQMGRNGVYYRKTWTNSKNKANVQNKTNNIRQYNQNSYVNKNNDEDLDEYNTEEICDSSSEELIEEIKNNYSKITLKWFSLLFAFNIYTFILSFAIFAYLDYKRKNTIIFYDIDEETEARLQEFYDSFEEITKCKRKWYILSKNYNFDAKYNSGASSLVNRKDIAITNKVPKYIKTNVKIPCVPVGKQKLYFFPDKILIIEGKKIGALSYKNIGISVTNGNFIETEMKPWDGTVVDYTYKYVNKNGGPDRRFSNNPRYPIMSYSYITFYGDNGFNECIMLSKQGVGYILKEQIFKLQNYSIHTENNTENQIATVNGITGVKNNVNEIAEINNIIKSTEKYRNEKENLNIIDTNLFKEELRKKDKSELKYTLEFEDDNYSFPPIELLTEGNINTLQKEKKSITDNAIIIQKTLYSFGVSAKVENVNIGPRITRYELKLLEEVKISKIKNLMDNIALNLGAKDIKMEAPIPGKQAVGIEVPNDKMEIVHLRDVIDTEEFDKAKSKLLVGLGKDISRKKYYI